MLQYKGLLIQGIKRIEVWRQSGIYHGEIYNGNAHGEGIWYNEDGDESNFGHWKEDKAHGYGVRIFNDDKRWEGEWNEGMKHGKMTVYNIGH